MRISNFPMTKVVFTLMGVVMFVGVVESGLALAGYKLTVYPASMCQKFNPETGAIIHRSYLGIANWDVNQDLNVICPIPKTVPSSKLKTVVVDVKDFSDSATIACHVRIYGTDGEFVYQKGGYSDQYFGGNSDIFIQDISYTGRGSSYNLTCTIPKRIPENPVFRIFEYRVLETTPPVMGGTPTMMGSTPTVMGNTK